MTPSRPAIGGFQAAAAGALALVVAGLAIGVSNERGFQSRRSQALAAQADVLAKTVEPALVFQDPAAAADAVSALEADSQIVAGGVYDARGARLAEFVRNGAHSPLRAPSLGRARTEGVLAVSAPVVHEGRDIGLVYLRTAREPFAEFAARHAGIALLMLIAGLIVGMGQAAIRGESRRARESQARAAELADLNRELQAQVERRESAEDALRQAQKMETLGQLTGGIAHDFNNLLQAVQGSLDLIHRNPGDPGRVARWARAGLEGAERGARLTAQLLAFSRAQKLEMKPLDVRLVVDRVRDLLPNAIGAGVSFRFESHTDQLWAVADTTQLELAVLNLCINARDAMPNGGEIRISTSAVSLEGDAELAAGEYARLAVTDTGVGMPEDVRARAFDPFFTTKGVGKGTGLGLAQVYGIARQAGGAARIESTPGQGATVSIYLPLASAEIAGAPQRRLSALAQATHAARILVVDDDHGVLAYVCDALSALGYDCLQASDAAVGLDLARSSEVDLLILDYAMPGMTGAELAAAALETRPDLPILFASGYAESAAIEAALGRPAQLLRKPFETAVLAARVADALAAR